jgi:hypothetical protein
MSALHAVTRALGQRPGEGAQDTGTRVGQQQIDQGFVPQRLASLGGRASPPAGFLHAPGTLATVTLGEGQQRGRELPGPAARPGEVSPGDLAGGGAKPGTQLGQDSPGHCDQHRLARIDAVPHETFHARDHLVRCAEEKRGVFTPLAQAGVLSRGLLNRGPDKGSP